MSNVTPIQANADQKIGQLKAILFLLQTTLDEIKEEVDKSYALLAVGEMTELSKGIENALSNPIDGVFSMFNTIDSQVRRIIHGTVKRFLFKNQSVIQNAFKSITDNNSLHYSIVLKDDNIDNRNQIFDFFDKYDLLEISSNYPVHFQFVPDEFSPKILFSEEIKFEA